MALTTRKLRLWKDVQVDIEKKLKSWNSQRNADNVTIPYGLQLEHNLSHPNPVRCMASQCILTGDIFVTNQGVGVTNQLYLWNIDADTNGAELKKYPVTPAMTLMKCIPKVHALVGYCSSDMTINIFTDMLHGFKQLSMSPMPTTVLSMAFLDDTDELVLGTVGSLLTFRLGMFDIRAKLVPSKPFITELTRDQWVLNLQVDRRTRQLIAMCDDGVFFINYSSRMQERFLPNWHQADLSCCIAYRPKEYFITAATDGTMKVWNSIVFSQVHEFMGHYGHITGLALHPRYPLLVSGSRDGSIRVWRLDTLEQTYRLDIGDDILEMSMLGSGTIFYRTKHQIKVWYLNQFHSTFSHVYCSVNKLVRINWAGLPSRVLVTGEDGSVRILSAVSGVVLNIIYPMATYQVLDNLVYDPSANRIFAVLKDGKVLVYDTSTNPCMPQQLLCPGSDDEQVLSAALIKLELALGQDETTAGKAVVFAGHKNGQLSLLQAPNQLKMYNIQAHSGQVIFLYSSHGKPNNGILGSVSRLVSCGTDKCVHIWGIGVEEDTIRLVCLSTVQCKVTPMLISMVGNILALVTIDGVLSMYRTYTKEERILEKTTYMPVSACAVPLTHHIEDDHKKGVTALCCSRTLGLFATTGKDACVKIWNTENKLVKELVLDNTLQGVCFANDRGDLLIGYQSHVSYVPLLNYLPKPCLEELVGTSVLDEQLEEPVPYDPSLQLLFTMDSIPLFPLDLKARREIKPEASLSIPLAQVSELEMPTQLSTKTSSFLLVKPSSYLRHGASVRTLASKASQVATSPFRLSPPLEPIGAIPSSVHKEEEGVVAEEEASPTETVPVESKSDQFTEKDRQTEQGKEEEEEDPLLKRKPIIAPDGYIPNSVIRFIIGYKPPPERPIQEEWNLKAAPSGELPSVEEEEEEAEDEEGRLIDWSSSPELDLRDDDERWKLPSPVRFGEKKKKSQEQKPSPKLDYTFRKVTFEPLPGDESPSGKKAKKAKEKKEWEGPTLLQNIVNYSWFPRDKLTDQELTVENVMAVLLVLLQDTSDIDRHKKVCQAITDIYKELGLSAELLDTVVKILLGQLGKRNAIVRRNSVRALGELGLDRKVVLMALISALTDYDKGVQKEAIDAIATVAGVKTKQDLAQVLQRIGVLKGPFKNIDRQNLKELEERIGKKGQGHTLQGSLSDEMNARIAMWNERIDQRHAFPPLETDFLDLIDKEDQLDQKKEKQGTKGAPRLAGKQKGRGPPSSKGSHKTTMSFKRHAKSRPKRPPPKITAKRQSRVKGDLASGKKWTMLHHNQAIRKMLIAKDLEESSSPVRLSKGTVTTQDQTRYVPEVPCSSRSESAADSTSHVAKVTSLETKEGHKDLSDADTTSTTHKLLVKEAIDDKSACQDDDTALGTDDAMSTAPTDDVASTAPTLEELELQLRRNFTDDYAATESSYEDSGLGQMSDTSSYIDGFRVRKPMQTHYFPPIKSGIPFELRSDSDKLFPPYEEEGKEEETEKWRQLFNRPSAQRRKRLYEERAKKLSGQPAKQSALPPIIYMKDMKQLTKGDLGQRLLLSVATHFAPEARKKLEGRDQHRITSLPHKLSSHTDTESYGCSNFGTLNMLWTTMAPQGPEKPVLYPHNSTFIPTKDGTYSQRQRKKPFRVPLPSLEMLTRVQAIQESGLLREKSLKKTFSRSYPSSTTPYSWSTPLPPARKLHSTLRKLDLSEVDLSVKPTGKERCVVHKQGHRCKVCKGYYSSPELAGRPESEEDPPTSAAPPPSRAEMCKGISLPILA